MPECNDNKDPHHGLSDDVVEIYEAIRKRDPDQEEFLQAVREVLGSLTPLFEKHPEYKQVFVRLAEPERVISFRVVWHDDEGNAQVNRAFRVQFNSAIGPYKGGLRFHPSVNLSVIKFLGFEQTFKNALTTLPLGGGKGGSDFDPKGKSDNEVQRFCQSLMTELASHIGPDRDVPAGDIGVGAREIGYMFGQYKRMTKQFHGVLTGKAPAWGGSLLRPEATGYGVVYFLLEMLKANGESIEGKRVVLSGAGNVSTFCCEKLIELGAVPVTLSDSNGFVHAPSGITKDQLDAVMRFKTQQRGRLADFKEGGDDWEYTAGERPWRSVECDIAIPCATQNEVDADDAQGLIKGGCKFVVEGANMPCTAEATDAFVDASVPFGPAKAANAGGVAVSGLEMAQGSQRIAWTREEVDAKLRDIMRNIHASCIDAAKKVNMPCRLDVGANVAGFLKVAGAMVAQGDT